MIEFLRNMYPYADIEYENLAIGGFQAPNLVRTAVHDIYPYYPDLLIFHVYGGEESGDLERIIYNTRKFTTSDILLFTHHYSWESDPEKMAETMQKDDMSSIYWRYLAQKYGCELVDVRKEWKRYLEIYPHIKINTLMGDTVHSNVHPNQKGNKLLELLILQHLIFNPNLEYLPYNGWMENVRTYEIKRFFVEKNDEISYNGKARVNSGGVILENGVLHLSFTGNRVVLNSIPEADHSGLIRVFIDSKPPSSYPELYFVTRPTKAFSHWRPALKRISIGNNPVTEKWSLEITGINRDSNLIEFKLYGDKTGFDGNGSNREDFISNSGKIRIDSADFFIFESEAYTHKPTPTGFKIEWEVKALFQDTISIRSGVESYLAAQGLSNTSHELKLIIEGNVPLASITTYSPPIK